MRDGKGEGEDGANDVYGRRNWRSGIVEHWNDCYLLYVWIHLKSLFAPLGREIK